MAEKKFAGVSGTVDSVEVNTDYSEAQAFDKVKVGRLGLYFKEGLRTRFVPYDYLERVFIRINEVNGKLCCGSTTFAYFRLILVHEGKEIADIISENEKALDEALALIAKRAPAVAIGVA